jgi:hypothetical protein
MIITLVRIMIVIQIVGAHRPVLSVTIMMHAQRISVSLREVFICNPEVDSWKTAITHTEITCDYGNAQLIIVAQYKAVLILMLFVLLLMNAILLNVFLRKDVFTLILLTLIQKLINV